MAYKKIIIISFLLLLTSCSLFEGKTIKPEEKKVTSESGSVLKKQDLGLAQAKIDEIVGVDITDTKPLVKEESVLKDEFVLVSDGTQKADLIIKSEKFKKVAKEIEDIHNKYLKEGDEKKSDYVKKEMVAKLVIDTYPNMDTYDQELLIQSIRRQDFKTLDEKKDITNKFKDYIVKNNFNPIDKKVEGLTKNVINDDVKFKEVFLDPISGVYYSIFSNRYNLNKTGIGFKPDDLETQIVSFLNQKLDEIYGKIGIDDEAAKKKVFSIYGYASLEDLGKDVYKDLIRIVEKYNLKNKNFSMGEEYSFEKQKEIFESGQENLEKYIDELVGSKKEEFKKDLIDFRLKMYLLSHFGKNHPSHLELGLWSSRARSIFINEAEGMGAQNLFRLSRYITPEKTEIKLD